MYLKRSHYCGQLRASHVGLEVTLCGWVDRWRDHGGIVFIDLRDREGIAQVVFDPSNINMDLPSQLRQEFVIAIRGKVRRRPATMENKNLKTGEIEVAVTELELLNRSQTLPFSLHDDSPSQGETDESLRLAYRYLDLRRPPLQNNLGIRHRFLKSVRDFYNDNGFWEIETPILYKSTPEGARDYLVPSRVYPGSFYALPQSPQTLKQLCMIAGFDRYFQIARCFRDEDLRADRQPEFTQIDVEMSFVDENDVLDVQEKMMKKLFKDVMGADVSVPFRKIPYAQAMLDYGSDKPDLRNSLGLSDLTEQATKSSFQVYKNAVEQGGIIKGLCFEEKQPISRSELDQLPAKVARFGAKGISWFRIKGPGEWQSPQAKFFDDALKAQVEAKLPFNKAAMLLLLCGPEKVVNQALDALRQDYG
ncbi:MAG: aspartate--tRNA ligase, partial [Deltaproteobacteria bacterium]|nr:aspartate--tRNA ligase [Deltaproteobacteria bacterium]